ncbi:cyclic nucleotide-gated cation channel beta-1-like isoform X1 [Eriocheir sinensis]|uniref:cyclic nucleotide-gated cation channel beta-1-like isoform X1 n=1 Tax=Eriocheir sinensis TaxID=95602 RepID=UPI0021C74CC1|nr:cyclic nucleotide-gated cation channel beta-1-like isoform X1 [Eriocheir sinensis]
MKTKLVSRMFPKTCSKHNIRRTVLGTCVVLAADGGASGGAWPRKVTITLFRRRGCWRALSSRKVAAFAFPEASGPISVTAPLDLEYLFRCSGKPDAEATQIKICVAYRRGATRKARVSLEEFLEALLDGGRPDSFFLYIYEDKVGLQQASQQFQALPTTWPLEEKPDKGKKAMHTEGNTDATYNEWKVFLEQVFSMEDDEGDTANDEDTYNEWKVYLEKVFAVEDHDDDTYNERKDLPERVLTVKDKDFGEAAHEVVEASDVDATEEEEASNVPAAKEEEEEASDVGDAEEKEASDVPAAEDVEASDVGAAEDEDASDVGAEGEEKASDVTAAEEEETSDVGAAEEEEASDATAVEKEEASDVPAAEEEKATDVPAAEEEKATDVPAAEEEKATDVPAAEEEKATDVPAAEEEKATDVPAAEEEKATDVGATRGEEASDVGAAEEEAPLHGEASRGEVHSPVTVPAAPATASLAYRSLTVAQRFISRLAGPSDRQLEDLRRSHGVSIVRVRRTLHIKGHRDAVLRCHRHIRDEIAEWRRREAAEAQ